MTTRGLLLVVVMLVAGAGAAEPAELSPAQDEHLRRGEVVLLDALPAGGSGRPAQGGTGLILVRAPLEIVWPLLLDYPRHAGLYPYVVRSEVRESTAKSTLVRYVVGVGPLSFGFHVIASADLERRRIEWQLARERSNGLFREGWGYWEISPHDDGVLLSYAMAARTVLPRFMTRAAERDGLVVTLKAVRERAERAWPSLAAQSGFSASASQ